MKLTTKVIALNQVGKALGSRLKHLGIEIVEDLLLYYPFRYEDFSRTVLIKDLQDGEEVTIKGKVELVANKRSLRKRKIITEAIVRDETDQIRLVWFGQPFLTQQIKAGQSFCFSGKVTSDMFGFQMVGPVYEREQNNTHTGRIVPLYSLTTGITQKQIRFLVQQILPLALDIPEWLPEEIQNKTGVISLGQAIQDIHFPKNHEARQAAERRLKFDEIFILQLRAEMIRQSIKKEKAPVLTFQEKEMRTFVESLPFPLTKAQKIASWEILQDIQKNEPMNRLLEGDVGSGKTVVAAMALYMTVLNGYQGILMVPTEILAKQHFETLKDIFGERAEIALLTRENKKAEVVEAIKQGKIALIVGTHALLSENVQFKKLGLVIVDEQHRFGVEQRKTIREKSGNAHAPHFLSMTATPIPRSFALTIYGDLDLSIINEMPPGRKPIKTRLVDPHNREKAYEFIREQVKGADSDVHRGRQVFVICPLIDASAANPLIVDDKKSVLSEYKKLSEIIFPDLRVGYLHGKMPARGGSVSGGKRPSKDEIMRQFAAGELDILVATSVVEVGVDIPNASVMMIEGAERFGLAQLHQFRGRVGRSEHQSYCFLFTDSESEKVRERLTFFEKTLDGFVLAEYDLKERGPGEVYGTAQSGMMNFRLATMRDSAIIRLARETARGLDFGEYAELKKKVRDWEKQVHLE